jgi:hypothetical protein
MIAALAAMMIAAECSVAQLQDTNGQGWSRYGGTALGCKEGNPPRIASRKTPFVIAGS